MLLEYPLVKCLKQSSEGSTPAGLNQHHDDVEMLMVSDSAASCNTLGEQAMRLASNQGRKNSEQLRLRRKCAVIYFFSFLLFVDHSR